MKVKWVNLLIVTCLVLAGVAACHLLLDSHSVAFAVSMLISVVIGVATAYCGLGIVEAKL